MSHLKPIYDVWDGNAEAMAGDIDELGVTVRQWRNRRDIPSRYWPKIIRAAAARGTVLQLADFLSPDAKSELPSHLQEDSAAVTEPSPNKDGENICPVEEGASRPFSPTSSRTSGPEPDSQSLRPCSNGPTATGVEAA